MNDKKRRKDENLEKAAEEGAKDGIIALIRAMSEELEDDVNELMKTNVEIISVMGSMVPHKHVEINVNLAKKVADVAKKHVKAEEELMKILDERERNILKIGEVFGKLKMTALVALALSGSKVNPGGSDET